MKIEQIARAPDTRDLERALWLSPLPPATRSATITSLREMVGAFGTDNILEIAEMQEILSDLTVERRNRLGKRATQILSDARRAMRIWSDEPTRWLATNLRGRLPTLRDAQMAAGLSMNKDEAARAVRAIDALAAFQMASPEDLTATEQTVGPILAGMSPESFGVATTKSLSNKRSLVLRAVSLVAPTSRVVRKAELDALQPAWKAQVVGALASHETSAAAIVKRFVVFADGLGIDLQDVSDPLVLSFYAHQCRQWTRAPTGQV